MTNREISAFLKNISQALELVSDNPFKARAYSTAARAVEFHPDSIAQLARDGKLSRLKGVGASVAEAIADIVETGASPLLSELLNEIPPDVWRMLSLSGLGPKRVRKLWRTLGVSTLDDLEAACSEDRLLAVEGFGDKIQHRILKGIESLRRNEGRLLLSAAHQIAREFTQALADNAPHHGRVDAGSVSLEITGALRRECETVDAIEIMAIVTGERDTHDISAALEAVAGSPAQVTNVPDREAEKGDYRGKYTRSMSVSFRGAKVVVHCRPPDTAVQSLFLLTGNSDHTHECAQLSPQPLEADSEFSGEHDIYSALGMDYVPPEMREGMGEVELAIRGELPSLIEDSDIRGILHVHTNYSDGSNSIEDIARYCSGRGYEYVGIADHSQSAFYAGGLSPSDLRRQREEIQEVQLRFPDIKILHGIESDILVDGSLDYETESLVMLDFVIGSVHSRFSMSIEDMTSRVIKAIRNPYLSILGHPTGRLLLSRDAYEIDLEAVLRALKREGKAVELNADPHRLDLDWRHCPTAKRMGIPVSINPDAHDTKGIENTRYGVAIGRKGWLSREDVLNCLGLQDIIAKFRSMRDS